jgi:hypothetical protein
MAFHPFRTFRKHQKVIWGFLVIVCMITFVLMSGTGRGDIFDRITQWVRNSRTSTPVTQLYGRTVDTRQLQILGQQRTVAANALSNALTQAYSQIADELNHLRTDQQNKAADPKAGIEQFMKQRKLEDEQKGLVAQIQRYGDLKALTRPDALLDFLVWQHQADQLRIRLDRDAVDGELKRLTGNRITLADVWSTLQRGVAAQLTQDQVEKAVAEEFRVSMAQQALLGEDVADARMHEAEASRNDMNPFGAPQPGGDSSRLYQVPAPVTPHEFWKYYENQRTAVDVALVPVPVEVASGQGSLTPRDLKEVRAMYDRYRGVEARPDQATPGFKVPRRIKVAWVRVPLDAPYYQKSAAETLKVLQAGLGFTAAGSAVLTGLPSIADPSFLSEFNAIKTEFTGGRYGRFDLAGLGQGGYPLSVYSLRPGPQEVAAAVGQAAGGSALLSPFETALTYQAGVYQRNARNKDMEALVAQEAREKRIPYGCGLLLAGASGAGPASLGGALTVSGLAAYGDAPQSLPATSALAQEMVRDRERATLTVDLGAANLRAFQKELDRQRARGANAEAKAQAVQKWLPKGLEEYHLEAMPRPMEKALDQFELGKAPAVAPLREALLRRFGQFAEQLDEVFAFEVFQGEGLYEPMVWPPGASLGGEPTDPRLAALGPRPPDREVFLVWRTENAPAYVPSFDQVKEEVIAAWRLQMARITAEDQGDKLKAAFAKTGGDLAQVTQLAEEKLHRKPEVLRSVAREVPAPVPVAAGRSYGPYQFPKDIAYPRNDWVNQLVDKLKKKGDTIVLADRPQKTYYLAVLLERHEPSELTFRDVYRDAAIAFNRDPMLDHLVQERRTKYMDEFVKQLRVEAGARADGSYELSDEYRKLQAGRESTEE